MWRKYKILHYNKNKKNRQNMQTIQIITSVQLNSLNIQQIRIQGNWVN